MALNLPKRKDIKAKYREPISESPMEAELYDVLVRSGVRGVKQYPIKGFFADIAYPEYKIVMEYDGEAFHTDKEKDAIRDEVFKKEGWKVYRVNKWNFNFEPDMIKKVLKDEKEERDYQAEITRKNDTWRQLLEMAKYE